MRVRQWESNFILEEASQMHTAIWLRLPQLATKFYDHSVLEKIGSKLGMMLKIDTCTSFTLRERYARACIQVPLGIPLKSHICIGHHKHKVVYEGDGFLFISYGRLGHIKKLCPHTALSTTTITEQSPPKIDTSNEDSKG